MTYVINIGTPSPLQDNFEDARTKLRNFVDTHKDDIKVNGVYDAVMEGEGIHRPGYQFCFWFDDETLAESFRKEFKGTWVIEGLEKPKTGYKETSTGAKYYAPYVPEEFDIGYKFRRQTQHGTQVRDSLDEEWQYLWDL